MHSSTRTKGSRIPQPATISKGVSANRQGGNPNAKRVDSARTPQTKVTYQARSRSQAESRPLAPMNGLQTPPSDHSPLSRRSPPKQSSSIPRSRKSSSVNIIKPQPNRQKPQGRVSPTGRVSPSEQVVSSEEQNMPDGTSEKGQWESGTGPWGQIRGKLGKLQALGDAMLEVASTIDQGQQSAQCSSQDGWKDCSQTSERNEQPQDTTTAPQNTASAPQQAESAQNPPATHEKKTRSELEKVWAICSSQSSDLILLKKELAATKAELAINKAKVSQMSAQEAQAKRRTQDLVRLLSETKEEAARQSKEEQSRNEEVDGMCAEYHKDQVVALQGQLNEARDELSSAIVKLKMQALDHEQEAKRIKWEHELERNRLQWDHEQEADRVAWDHKQTLMRVMPTAQKLQKELEQVTARLLDAQEDNRAMQAKFEAIERGHKLDKAKLQQRVVEISEELEKEKDEHQEDILLCREAPGSPSKSTMCNICMDKNVKMVFPCGHAKCAECASRLVGMGQGCPDCRAPLGPPQMLFLSVG